MMLWLLTACQMMNVHSSEPDWTETELMVYKNTMQQFGLRDEIYQKARTVYENATASGVADTSIMTIVDLSMHSKQKRLWTIDFSSETLLYNLAVSHGRGSDADHDGLLDSVSNVPNSKQTSMGLYKTAETYNGQHGYSLRLDGLESKSNGNARKRAIVVHGAEYMTDAFIQQHGKAGRSFGCPAVSSEISEEFIDTIKDGSLIWMYVPDEIGLMESTYRAPSP